MALSIKDEETDALVRKLAKMRKLSYTAAIRLAVHNELARGIMHTPDDWEARWRAVEEIQARSRALPILDGRSGDEILGYDEDELPS